MHACPQLLTGPESAQIADMFELFLVSYQALAKDDEEKTRAQLWKIKPKSLYLAHIASSVRSTRLNPRYTACSCDEDYLGKLKKIATKTHARTCMLRTLQRVVLGWCLRWERRRRGGRFRL